MHDHYYFGTTKTQVYNQFNQSNFIYVSLVTSKAYETQHLYINIIIQGLTRNKCNYTRSHTFYIYHALLAKDNHAQLPYLVKVCDLSFETY